MYISQGRSLKNMFMFFGHTRAWIEKSVENRSVFVKIREIDPVLPVFDKLVSESDFFKFVF
jgi:hypothetical protein